MALVIPAPDRSAITRIYPRVYLMIWIVSLMNAAYVYFQLQRQTLLGFGALTAALFGASTVVILLFIYRDMELLDDNLPDPDYPSWPGLRPEKLIRFGILLAQLLGVGEIGHVFEPYIHFVRDISHNIEFLTENVFYPRNAADPANSLFVIGSVTAFALIAIWNWCALYYVIQEFLLRMKSKRPAIEAAHDVVVLIRITFFGLISLLSTVYWILVFLGGHQYIADWSKIFVISQLIGFFVVIMLRIRRSRIRIESSLASAFRAISTSVT